MIEGTVSLPSSQKWTLHFYARTDGDVNLPSEYINLYINGALIDKVFNTPPNKFTPYSVEFTGDELTYRFEFSSPSTTFTDHMLVLDGIVSPEKNDGLVAYYPFNGNADDLSGNGNNGIVHGAALTEDRFGNANSAYHFDGIDDYIMIPHSEDFKFGVYDFTISLWLQYPSQTGGTHDYSAVFMKVENSSFPWDGITFFVDYPNQGNTCFRTDARYYLLSNTDA